MATSAVQRIILRDDTGQLISGAYAELRSDGAWDVEFRIPWEPSVRRYVRSTMEGATQLLEAAAGEVVAALRNIAAERQRVTDLADAQPVDNRP